MLIFLCFTLFLSLTTSQNPFQRDDPVVVIGGISTSFPFLLVGGISGLAAACELRSLGHNVVLLEKQPSIGGR